MSPLRRWDVLAQVVVYPAKIRIAVGIFYFFTFASVMRSVLLMGTAKPVGIMRRSKYSPVSGQRRPPVGEAGGKRQPPSSILPCLVVM